MGKKIGIGIGAFFGVIIIVAVVAVVMLTRAPSAPAAPPPPPSSGGPAASPTLPLEEQYKKIEEALKSSQPQEVTLTVTEQMINAEINKVFKPGMDLGGIVVQEVIAYLRPGMMQVNLKANVPPIPFVLYPTLKVGITVKDGKPLATVQSVDVGTVGLPDNFRQQINDMAAGELAKLAITEAGVEVKSVTIGDGFIKIVGMTKPK